MRKTLPLLLILAGCSSRANVETAALVSDAQLVVMAGEDFSGLTRNDKERLDCQYPNTLKKIDQSEPLTMQDIKNLTRSGVSDKAIIYLMHETRSSFYLTPEDETELMHAGVSNKVIEEMKDSARSRY